MKYKGMELVEITERQVFDPPRLMLVWDDGMTEAVEEEVCAILPHRTPACRVVGYYNHSYAHCAEIPEEPKPRRATNRELAKWLAHGNGQISRVEVEGGATVIKSSSWDYYGEDDSLVKEEYRVRKWDDTGWHEPTTEYMGLKE